MEGITSYDVGLIIEEYSGVCIKIVNTTPLKSMRLGILGSQPQGYSSSENIYTTGHISYMCVCLSLWFTNKGYYFKINISADLQNHIVITLAEK